MRVQRRFGQWVICAATLILPATALAQSAPSGAPAFPPCAGKPSSADVSGAQGAFQAGWVSFDEGDYARAITYWEDAFRRDCTATALLLNLSRAYELAGAPDKAAAALQTYLEREPKTEEEERAVIERRLEALRPKNADEQPSQPAIGAPSDTREPRPDPTPPPRGPDEPASDATTRALLPMIVSGVGVAAFVAGGALYLDAKGQVDSYDEQCTQGGTRHCADSSTTREANSARTSAMITSAVSLAGATAAVGGLVWYFVSGPKPTPRRDTAHVRRGLAVHPDTAPGYAGLVLQGAY